MSREDEIRTHISEAKAQLAEVRTQLSEAMKGDNSGLKERLAEDVTELDKRISSLYTYLENELKHQRQLEIAVATAKEGRIYLLQICSQHVLSVVVMLSIYYNRRTC